MFVIMPHKSLLGDKSAAGRKQLRLNDSKLASCLVCVCVSVCEGLERGGQGWTGQRHKETSHQSVWAIRLCLKPHM